MKPAEGQMTAAERVEEFWKFRLAMCDLTEDEYRRCSGVGQQSVSRPPEPIRTEPDHVPWYATGPVLIFGGLSLLVALMVMFYVANGR